MLGRSALFGLGAGGSEGLSDILDLISTEASAVMGLVGHQKITEISANNIACTRHDAGS